MSYFREIPELCASQGIEVILVEYPVTPGYQVAAAPLVEAGDFNRKLEALVAPFDNVHRIEARKWFLERMELFRDWDHLNSDGAKVLSVAVREEIDRQRRSERAVRRKSP